MRPSSAGRPFIFSIALLCGAGIGLSAAETAQAPANSSTPQDSYSESATLDSLPEAANRLQERLLQVAADDALTARREIERSVFTADESTRRALLDLLCGTLESLSGEIQADGEKLLPPEPGLLPLLYFLPMAAERQQHRLRITEIQRKLVRWIGVLADTGQVDVLVRYLGDSEIGEEASDALARIGSAEAVQALADGIENAPEPVKPRIIRALAACNAVEAVPKLGELALRGDIETRWAARDALSRMGVVLPEIAPLERDAPPRLAARYAQGCLRAALLAAEPGDRTRAERLLLGFTDLYARNHQIRAALLALSRIRSAKLARTALSYVNTPGVRDAAIRALVEDNSGGVEEEVLKAYPLTDPSMQAGILEVLQRRGSPKAAELLTQAAGSPHSEVRATAAWLRGAEASDADLGELLGRGSPWARQAALQHGLAQAWRRVESGEFEAARALFELIIEGRFPLYARQNAMTGLERLANPASRPLIERYVHDPDIAEEASRALVAVVAAQDDPERAGVELRALAEETPHAAASAAAVSVLSARGEETEELIERRGYLTEWRVIGPFRDADGAAATGEIIAVSQGDPPETVAYNEDTFTWKEVSAAGLPARVDLAVAFDGAQRGTAYGYTRIAQPGWQPADLWIESEEACSVWLNGKQVFERVGPPARKGDEEQVRILLNPGVNRLLIRVLHESGPWGYCVRLTDRRGNPIDTGAQRLPDDGTAGIGARPEELRPALGDETP